MKDTISNHRIFVNYRSEDVLKKHPSVVLAEVDESSLDGFRDFLTRFRCTASPNSVALLDASKMTDKQFSACLKLMEEEGFAGRFWFYGAPLSQYPFTVRSRCFITVKEYQAELKTTPAKKTEFMDFMHTLDMMKPTMFNTVSAFLGKIPGDEFAGLFGAWQDGDAMFTPRELGVCKFLKSDKFFQIWQESRLHEEYLLLFLICYKVMFVS